MMGCEITAVTSDWDIMYSTLANIDLALTACEVSATVHLRGQYERELGMCSIVCEGHEEYGVADRNLRAQ